MNLCNSPGNHREDHFFLFVIQFWCVTFSRAYHSLMTYSKQGYEGVKGEKSRQNKVVWREKQTAREKFRVTSKFSCGSFLPGQSKNLWSALYRKKREMLQEMQPLQFQFLDLVIIIVGNGD